jgi:hypothetical protein
VDKATCMQGPEIQAKIFMPKCASCHGGAMPRAGLNLEQMGAKMRLLNQPAKSAMSGCANKPLITADAAGVFFDKISGTGCGNMMPAAGPKLSNQEKWCLQEWIKPGAGGTFPDPPVTLAAPGGTPTPTPTPTPAKGDGGVPNAPMPMPATCASADAIRNDIFLKKCMPCHGSMAPALGLDLQAPGAKARLLNVTAKGCIGKILAKPDGTGHLFDKITGPIPANCGQQMPYGGLAPLTPDEVNCLKAWIQL